MYDIYCIYLYKTGHSKQCNSECFACFFSCVPNPFDGTVIIKVEDQSSDQRLSPSRQTRHERLEHIRAVDQWQSCSDTAGIQKRGRLKVKEAFGSFNFRTGLARRDKNINS